MNNNIYAKIQQFTYFNDLCASLILASQSLTLWPTHFLEQPTTHIAGTDRHGGCSTAAILLTCLHIFNLMFESLATTIWRRWIALTILESTLLGPIAIAVIEKKINRYFGIQYIKFPKLTISLRLWHPRCWRSSRYCHPYWTWPGSPCVDWTFLNAFVECRGTGRHVCIAGR